MEPNVIFIELENPRDLIIAVKTDKDGYYRNYTLMDAEYGKHCNYFLYTPNTLYILIGI